MAYRGDDAGDALVAPTANGELRAELGPTVTLAVGERWLQVSGRFATLADRGKTESIELARPLVVARDLVYDDVGIWIELDASSMRRIFGVRPISTLEPGGLDALRRLEDVVRRVRAALAPLAGDVVHASELGRVALDKVLLLDRGDRHELYARRLFKDRARLVLALHTDGRAIVDDVEVSVPSSFAITVRGDHLRFADATGIDRAQVALPWLTPEERHEVARRLGTVVDVRARVGE
jgi:hypothetical protein